MVVWKKKQKQVTSHSISGWPKGALKPTLGPSGATIKVKGLDLIMKTFKTFLTRKIYNKIWKQADDIIERTSVLEDLYEDVPEDMKKIPIQVMEIHLFPEESRDRVAAFLNNEPYNNSIEFIKDE